MRMIWTVERDLNDYSVVEGNRQVAGYIVERKAARIMAAAPDLLEALRDLRDNVERDMAGYWTESTANLMQQADAAIAKAEGKTAGSTLSAQRSGESSSTKGEADMGQAFDRDGNVLGEATGDSMRDVFNKLIREHKDAAEIRIREVDGALMELPRYKCHKEVWALKIQEVIDPTEPGNESDGSRVMRFVDHRYAPIRLDGGFVRKHNPQAGGYYVVYKDGYKSFSPADAFEDGYTLIQ